MHRWLGTLLVLLMTACMAPPVAAAKGSARPSVSGTFRQVRDTVVVIETVQKEVAPRPGGGLVNRGGIGSGVLIGKGTQVLTAAHVVQTAEKVRVHFTDGLTISATVLRSNPQADLALLELEHAPAAVKPAKLGNSDDMEVGDQVMVIGAPLGISHTLTVGYLSARREPNAMLAGFSVAELFQTDAAINQGNSGGPMFNMKGEVIGVVSHIVSLSGGSDGLGFAVTSNATKELLLEGGGLWTGMSGHLLSDDLAAIFNSPSGGGLLVERVAKGSFAEKFGLRGGNKVAAIGGVELVVGGDIIVEVFGIPIGARDDLRRIQKRVRSLKPGATVQAKIVRGGEVRTLSGTYTP